MKLRQHIGSILFVVAAIASGVYAALDERMDRSPSAREEARVLPSFDRGALTRIEMERGGERLVLERAQREGKMRMTSPAAAETDPASVDQLVALLETATVVRVVPDAAPSAAPRVRVRLTFGSRVAAFALSEPAPVPSGAAYADLEDGRRIVVRRELATELLRSFDAYRDRALLSVNSGDVARLEIRDGAGPSAFDRQPDGSFRAAGGLRIARTFGERWLTAVGELRATSFASLDALDARAAEVEVSVTAADGRRDTVRFLGPCPTDDREVLVTTSGAKRVAACLPRSVAQAFEVVRVALVDRRLVALRSDEVVELTLEASRGPVLSLARAGGSFRQRRPDARDLDPSEGDVAAALLDTVLSTEGPVVPASMAQAPGALGARPPAPALVLALVRVGTDAPERVEIVDVGTASFAHRLADDAWLALDAASRRALEPPAGGVRAPWLLPREISPDAIERVSIRCGASVVLSRGDGGFSFDPPRFLPADSAHALELVERLSRVRARAIVSEPLETKSACSVTLSGKYEGGAVQATLSFFDESKEPDARLLARRDGEREAMVVDRSLKAALSESLEDRSASLPTRDGAP